MDAHAIESYKKAGNLTARAREYGATLIKPGVKLADVAAQVERFVLDNGGGLAFPCCISLNADAAHFTPGVGDERVFQEGDVVKLDTGVHFDGWVGDTAITVEVGTERFAAMRQAVREALEAGVSQVRPNVAIEDVSRAVEQVLRSHGLQPIVNLTGHSLDHYHLHAGLSIPNVAASAHGRIGTNIAIAIEPFGTDGAGKVKDSQGGHIYHYMGSRPVRDPQARAALEHIQKHHEKLPFAERWLAGAIPEARIPYAMRMLERAGAVKQYPVLREAKGGQVAQFEHTVLVLEDEVVVTTRL
jgi:methionyl aminopeptidase